MPILPEKSPKTYDSYIALCEHTGIQSRLSEVGFGDFLAAVSVDQQAQDPQALAALASQELSGGHIVANLRAAVKLAGTKYDPQGALEKKAILGLISFEPEIAAYSVAAEHMSELLEAAERDSSCE